MDTWAIVWVSIISGLVVILLVCIIALTVMVVSIVKTLKRVAEKAEQTTENLSSVAASVGRRVAPLALSTIVAAILRRGRRK